MFIKQPRIIGAVFCNNNVLLTGGGALSRPAAGCSLRAAQAVERPDDVSVRNEADNLQRLFLTSRFYVPGCPGTVDNPQPFKHIGSGGS